VRDTIYFGGTDDHHPPDASIDSPCPLIVARIEFEVLDVRSRFAVVVPDDDPRSRGSGIPGLPFSRSNPEPGSERAVERSFRSSYYFIS
jgi:hypothetical protein